MISLSLFLSLSLSLYIYMMYYIYYVLCTEQNVKKEQNIKTSSQTSKLLSVCIDTQIWDVFQHLVQFVQVKKTRKTPMEECYF